MTKPASLLLPQADVYSIPAGGLIITRYVGPTDHKCSRVAAIYKRDNETTFRAVVTYNDEHGQLDAHYQAALAVLRKVEADNDRFAFSIQAVGTCADCYAFVMCAHCREGIPA